MPLTPGNLSLPPTSFIGRKRELSELKQLLDPKAKANGNKSYRLITLVGAGGVGKTRLSIQVANKLLNCFEHGVWFIDLVSLTDPSYLPKIIARAFELREEAQQSVLTTLNNYLKKRELLLVLDNCEHLLKACVELIDDLLKNCSELRVLATSREALNIPLELPFYVPSLSMPNSHEEVVLKTLSKSEAVQLFEARAKISEPGFSLTISNAPAVTQIVKRLDGIPLAIELAAARLNLLSTKQIAQRLDDRFQILTNNSHTVLPRHQTLGSLIDWSYELLEEPTRLLLERLSVFNGGWILEAAEAICSDQILEHGQILDEMGQLVSKSLVVVEHNKAEEKRYRFLETIRQYAHEKFYLNRPKELTVLAQRHAEWYLALIEEATPALSGPEQKSWAERLDLELDNLRVALNWFLSSQTEFGLQLGKAVRLVTALHSYWLLRGEGLEGRDWLQKVLALSSDYSLDPIIYIKALNALASLENVLYNHRQVQTILKRSLALAREHDYQPGIASALSQLGYILIILENYSEAKLVLEESLEVCQKLNDKNNQAFTLRSLAQLSELEGDFQEADNLRFQGVKLYRELGNKRFLASLLNEVIRNAVFRGDYSEQALRFGEEGLSLSREVGYKLGIATLLFNLGRLTCKRGDYQRSAAYFRESLQISYANEVPSRPIACLQGIADLAATLHHAEKAIRLLAATNAFLENIAGVSLPGERTQIEQMVELARSQLSEESFNRNWLEGKTMTIEQAFKEALHFLELAEKNQSSKSIAGLTNREIEVLRLLAQGLTNREIAERLVLSPKTISTHLEAIFRKLDINSRSAATRFAIENKLI